MTNVNLQSTKVDISLDISTVGLSWREDESMTVVST